MGVFACYRDQNGKYQWTDKPDSNWELIERITSPDQIPTSSSTPTPSPTPTPTSNPTPIDYQTATTYRVDDIDGSYTVYDKYRKSELYSVKPDGTLTILNGKYANFQNINDGLENLTVSSLSFDDKTDTITIKNADDKPLLMINSNRGIVEKYEYDEHGTSITKYDYNGSYINREEHLNDGTVEVYHNGLTKTINADGSYETYENGNTIQYDANDNKTKTLFANGSYETYENGEIFRYDANSNEYMKISKNGERVHIKYDSDGNEYLHVYDDGKKVYLNSNNESLIIYPNGTYYDLINNKKGTYTVETSGNIKCVDSDNNTYLYNSTGTIIKTIDNSGKIVEYDYDNMKQTTTKDGTAFVSRINHIEYDEEVYNNILNTLNSIDGSSINTSCSNVINTINSFPDKCPVNGISLFHSNISNHLDLISSLSEMTNYSLLAYQACDDLLKDNLNALIDSLFDEKQFADMFKKSISSIIEDRNNDGILEYKLDTDFNALYDNLIPTQTYTDENGNMLYFNSMGKLLNAKGDNIKINYGGENFTLNFGENGCAILKDSNGNPLNIFGDYNIDSGQYGGNQDSFYNNTDLLKNENINAILDKYYPEASTEEKIAYLNVIGDYGCGYVALANTCFKMLEGHEVDFQNKSGYPMYNIVYKDNEVSVDYNYEPLVLELHAEYFGKDWEGNTMSIKDATHGGITPPAEYRLEKYLIDKYNIYDYNKDTSVVRLNAGVNYVLDDLDGDVTNCKFGHAMIITEKTRDGQTYVSSNGKKYLYELLENGVEEEYTFPLSDAIYQRNDRSNGKLYFIEYKKHNDEISLTAKKLED